MSQNLIEKITQRFAVDAKKEIKSGDFVMIRPKHILTHDNTAAVMTKFKVMGAKKMHNPRSCPSEDIPL